VTVPPINELLGAQMLLVPLITALSNSPEYDTPTPPTDPAADSPPFEPRVKLVQLVQTVTAGGVSQTAIRRSMAVIRTALRSKSN
jgi:hypothetical protein